MLDMSAFAKCRISGPGAEAWLDNLLANRLPKTVGRIGLCHALNICGGVRSEFTVMREAEDSFLSGLRRRACSGSTTIISRSNCPPTVPSATTNSPTRSACWCIAGPRARELMQRVSQGTDFSNEAFPWLTGQQIDVGLAPTLAQRHQFRRRTGLGAASSDRVPEPHLRQADGGGRGPGPQALRHPRHGLTSHREVLPAGGYRALHRIRGATNRDLERFVHPNKGDFIGRDALVRWQQEPVSRTPS